MTTHPSSRLLRDFTWIAIAYILAAGAGIASLFYLPEDMALIWKLAVADVVATVVIFIFSMIFNNSSFYDAYWSVIPPLLMMFWVFWPVGSYDTARLVIAGMLCGFWAWRLTANWSRGWTGIHHEDWRYKDLRIKTGKMYWLVSFLGLHFFPTLLVFVACTPFMAMTDVSGKGLNALDLLAGIVTLSAIILEATADEQMYKAILSGRLKKGEVFTGGLWKYSRHPNYLGEILFWWGIFLFGIAASEEYWWTIAGPVGITLLFIGVSIPMMDKRSLERREGFREYMRKTSALLLLPPRK